MYAIYVPNVWGSFPAAVCWRLSSWWYSPSMPSATEACSPATWKFTHGSSADEPGTMSRGTVRMLRTMRSLALTYASFPGQLASPSPPTLEPMSLEDAGSTYVRLSDEN